MKNKEFITSAAHLIAILSAAGYNVENNEYGLIITKNNVPDYCFLRIVNKFAPTSRWSRVSPAQTGFLLKKPYELQGRYDRSNSGQITIAFGKAIVDEIMPKIDAMYSDLVKYYEAQQEQKNADQIATDFLVSESSMWNKTESDYPKGFIMIPQPDGTKVERELIELGVTEVYYSFAHKSFIFTKKSIPYLQRLVDYNSNNTKSVIDIESIEKSVKFYRQVADLISNLNEYEQG
jgi:hypothetical protein